MSRPATPSAPKPSARAAARRLTTRVCPRAGHLCPDGSWRHHACKYNHTMALPIALYSTAQVRALDAYAIETLGIPGYTLMKRAGESALRALRSRWPMAHRVVVVCGGGNNGGDGYVLARFAQAAGLTVTVAAASVPEHLHDDARRAYEDLRISDGRVQPFAPALLSQGEVIVDALLGTGLRDGVTITFVGLKTGLFVGDGPQYCGTIVFDDLELAAPPTSQFAPRLTRIVEAEIHQALPRRARDANKGDFGRVLIVGSGSGMPGGVRLAGEACLRAGAGLTTVAVAPENVAAIAAGRPELICV